MKNPDLTAAYLKQTWRQSSKIGGVLFLQTALVCVCAVLHQFILLACFCCRLHAVLVAVSTHANERASRGLSVSLDAVSVWVVEPEQTDRWCPGLYTPRRAAECRSRTGTVRGCGPRHPPAD